MKGFWVKYTVVITILIILFSLSGCGKGKNEKHIKVAQTQAQAQAQKEKLEIKNFVSEYYESEVSKDEEYLSSFFINPNAADIQEVKNKFKAFNMERIKFNGVYNIKLDGKLAAMTGSFNAYFKGVSNPRPDVEIIILINKNNKWYFLNDDSGLNENELRWTNTQRQVQSKFIVSDKSMNKILEANKVFDEANKDYMDQCKKKLLNSQSAK